MGIDPADHLASHTGGWSSTNVVRLLASGQGQLAAIVVAVLLAIFHILLGDRYWRSVRETVFDTYQCTFPRQVEGLPVIIVDIDDASFAAMGQWPWPRTRLARLVEATRQMGGRSCNGVFSIGSVLGPV